MVWSKDENGNWGNFHEPSPPEPEAEAAAPAHDDVSYDGTQFTSVTVEEVYNARDNTVEQKNVHGSRSSGRNQNIHSSNPPTHRDDQEGDSGSMSSMSMLFREARGSRHQSTAERIDYANYQIDDDATVDSLSDVFGKNGAMDKKKKKNSLVQKWANSKAQAKTIVGNKKKSDRNVNNETLDGIIDDVADLHDQESPHQIDDIPEPEDPGSFVDIPVGGPEENEKDDDPKAIAEEPKNDISFDVTEPADASSKASSKSSSSTTSSQRKRSKRGMSNKKMCCWIFGGVAFIAVFLIVFFQVYYRVQGKNEKGVSSSSDSGNIDESVIYIDESGMKIPTQPPAPTLPPTKYGETHAPTVTRYPTNPPIPPPTQSPTTGPTENYIDPLMEFLQDNQVYFEKDPLSPDFMAVQWLADEANVRTTDGISSAYGNGLELNEKLIQRFALLTLDYSLNRPNATVAAALKQNRQHLAQKALTFSDFDYDTYERASTIAIKEVDECSWEGVVCYSVGSKAGQIEEIDFSYSSMTGTIPPEIKLLKNLRKLDLAGNQIHGPIPNSIYKIQGLEELYLYKNELTGTISTNIANWWNLTHLHLSHNELTGSIPLSFKSGVAIRPIRYLNLYSNQLTGTIPDNLRFRKITFADFGRNKFSGTLPEDIGVRWVELRYLYLDHNQFTGTIPYSYPTTGNGRVETMVLNHNQLSGNVPGQFYHNKLLEFNVHNNTFTGVDYKACKQSVFDGGEMIEYKADCDICYCDPFCKRKCTDEDW